MLDYEDGLMPRLTLDPNSNFYRQDVSTSKNLAWLVFLVFFQEALELGLNLIVIGVVLVLDANHVIVEV